MVKALHRGGIEVILDVVFNHTAEGDHAGPTLCFRGLDNPVYYMLDADKSRYADYSGCGNSLNALASPPLGDVCRWFPVRSCVSPFARFFRPSGRKPTDPMGYRVGPGSGRHEADGGGVGRRRSEPGRQLRRRQLEGVEWTVP